VKAVAITARRHWRLRPNYVAAFVPIVTGVMAGLKHQLLGYSNVFDDDAGERADAIEISRAGYKVSSMVYGWRTVELGLALIGSAEYDGTMRELRRLLFTKGQPWVNFLEYGTYPARGWMFKYDGRAWGMSKSRVYRSGRIRGRELGASLP
jgi:hypothetical protein